MSINEGNAYCEVSIVTPYKVRSDHLDEDEDQSA
jgi:hypothetical protein